MRIISYKKIREFCDVHPEAKGALDEWYKRTQAANWENLSDTKRDFPHADPIGVCICFNVGGNKYRVITKIKYSYRIVYIRFVLTHADYSKKVYKDDCNC